MTIKDVRRLGAAWLAACAWPAAGGPLAISPTTVEIAPDRRSAVLEVVNAADAPVDLQVRAYAWTQADGRELLSPTDALVVSPAIATVPPGGKQVFRVLRAGAGPRTGERAFRLRLNELPRPGGGVAINLEFSIPVFETVEGAAPALDWSPVEGGLAVANRGGRRVRIKRLALAAAGGAPVEIETARSAYLLPGAARRFALPAGAVVPPGARLVGQGDAGPVDAPRAPAAR